ncbi:hypothetical protein [Pleionea sediminis]|uniref:hypothetical protein n=1 Tax=Pleionea sediminis TaxID=2569479 RepID=UPI001184825B|nr:hypothetical protein [Pleionea sediminis]
MKISLLKQINELPIATSKKEVDERIFAVIEFYKRSRNTPKHLIAETMVDILGYETYSESVTIELEHTILQWINESFDENDDRYMDALATVYANMCSSEALKHLQDKATSISNLKSKKYLEEAINEFVQKTQQVAVATVDAGVNASYGDKWVLLVIGIAIFCISFILFLWF